MGGETSYRIIPFITHNHYEIKAGSAPLPVLGARKETNVATLVRKSSFADIAAKIDDLYYSIAMNDQADQVDIELISSSGKFPNYHIPGGLVDSSLKDFLRMRMEEKINQLKSELSALVTVYEIPVDVPLPPPVADPVPPAPTPTETVPVPAPDVPVQPVDPNAGPTPQ